MSEVFHLYRKWDTMGKTIRRDKLRNLRRFKTAICYTTVPAFVEEWFRFTAPHRTFLDSYLIKLHDHQGDGRPVPERYPLLNQALAGRMCAGYGDEYVYFESEADAVLFGSAWRTCWAQEPPPPWFLMNEQAHLNGLRVLGKVFRTMADEPVS